MSKVYSFDGFEDFKRHFPKPKKTLRNCPEWAKLTTAAVCIGLQVYVGVLIIWFL